MGRLASSSFALDFLHSGSSLLVRSAKFMPSLIPVGTPKNFTIESYELKQFVEEWFFKASFSHDYCFN
jgi:hypothetical protein